jgi:UDP-D-galactose:(glucosyl)LPS alpha-1,6-D-galactosyltransferase
MGLKATNILFVLERPKGQGGMENVTSQVLSQLKSDGSFDVGLFLYDSAEKDDSNPWLDEHLWGVSAHFISNPKISRFVHALRLAWTICKRKPDHIIALNTIPCQISRWAIMMSCRKVKLFSWMHLPPKDRYRPQYLMLADEHLAISREIGKQLIDLGAPPSRVHVIFNPVKVSQTVIPRPEGDARFLFVGRVHFEEQKQLKDLFDALQQTAGNWSLDIVGDGDDRPRCEAYTRELGIADKISWHGWQENTWDYIAANIKETTSLVLTSNHEGFPLILLEAMARGIFCVSSDCVSGPSEIIVEGINGHLYPVNDTHALTKFLQAQVDGEQLSGAQVIKESIAEFYEPRYMERIKGIIGQDNAIEKL